MVAGEVGGNHVVTNHDTAAWNGGPGVAVSGRLPWAVITPLGAQR